MHTAAVHCLEIWIGSESFSFAGVIGLQGLVVMLGLEWST